MILDGHCLECAFVEFDSDRYIHHNRINSERGGIRWSLAMLTPVGLIPGSQSKVQCGANFASQANYVLR